MDVMQEKSRLAPGNSQKPLGSYAGGPWDKLPEYSGSIHHLRD
jgi:hypothetical protein